MNLIIDKSNVLSLLSNTDSYDLFECSRLIKRGISLCFNFPKEDVVPGSSEGNKILMWLGTMTSGRKTPMPQWAKFIDSSSIKSNFATTLNCKQKRNVYLLDNTDVVPKVKNKGAILIGGVGQEAELLLSLRLEDTETPAVKISSWKDYCPKLPLTDIIICDNHFFKNHQVYTANKDELINGLVQLPQQSPVNCVIVVKINEIDPSFILESVAADIRKSLKRITDSTKSTVTIIGTYATHDRCAITNYYRLKHGSCFHLINNNLKPDVTTEVKTHANVSTECITDDLILTFQKIINTGGGKYIYGDRVSNFLKFPD